MQCNRVQNCCTSRQLTDISQISVHIHICDCMSSYTACYSNSCCQKISYTLCECTRNKNLKSHIKNARMCEEGMSLSPASLRCTQCCHISRPTLTAAATAHAPAPATPPSPSAPSPSPWGWLCCFKWFRFHVHADFMPL